MKTLKGKIITLQFSAIDHVLDLKKTISVSEGIPSDQQRLIMGGKQLEDTLTLGNSHVKHGSVLQLQSRLLGGKPSTRSSRLAMTDDGDSDRPAVPPLETPRRIALANKIQKLHIEANDPEIPRDDVHETRAVRAPKSKKKGKEVSSSAML